MHVFAGDDLGVVGLDLENADLTSADSTVYAQNGIFDARILSC